MNLLQYTDGFFKVNATHGFLPCQPPLAKLPKRYSSLQRLLDDMPRITHDQKEGLLSIEGALESRISQLEDFSQIVKEETDPFVLQALFRGYSFLTSAYTLAPAHFEFLKTGKYGKANRYVPSQLAMPFCWVARQLEVFPWLDYHYAYSLGNYVKKDPKGGLNWENLDMAVKFSGMPDERGFIMLHVDINQHSPKLVEGVLNTLEELPQNNASNITKNLALCRLTMKKINTRRKVMWEASRWKHYNDFRVFIMGIKGNEEIFDEGIFYQGVYDTPKQYRGQTGAQDNIIPMMDIFTGVIKHYPKNELTKYLMDLRSYRPTCIQRFLEDLRLEVQGLHEEGVLGMLVKQNNVAGMIELAGILQEIYFFRNGHWQFVQKYIMQNTAYSKATGGTPIISWIPNQIRSVLNALESCLDQIPEETNSDLYVHIKTDFPIKVQLLDKQLKMLHQPDYKAKEVFDLNKKMKLADDE